MLGPAAAVVYLAGAARAYFDEDVANKVLERERAKRRGQLERGRTRARARRTSRRRSRGSCRRRASASGGSRTAIAAAELPYEEVADEVDRFVAAMEATARRAQLLRSALADTPAASASRRGCGRCRATRTSASSPTR